MKMVTGWMRERPSECHDGGSRNYAVRDFFALEMSRRLEYIH
jgi:hypothetical protein